MPPTQAHRFLSIQTSLGADTLLVKNFSMTEHLGRLFQIEVELRSHDRAIKFDDVVGTNAIVELDLPNGKKRHFNGFINHFMQVEHEQSFAIYRATIVPWLWFLTRASDCRIFQKKKVPDIIEEVFKGHGFKDYKLKLSDTYREWEYCVQYRETDFNFVSRLMEQEGIYYFFEHKPEGHILILTDAPSAHETFPGYASMVYRPPTSQQEENAETVTDWIIEKQVQPGQYALGDFNFETPKTPIRVNSNIERQHEGSGFEVFDYPGVFTKRDEGERYAKVRIQEMHSQHEILRGQATVRGVSAGYKFKLESHPRSDQNRQYLITGASIHINGGEYETGRAPEGEFYSCGFTAMPASEPYRAPRSTPKPLIQGPQTAIVTGPAGEEIHTDEHGRVKVHFHWDRHGKFDDNSSCWIRVSQYWAGKAWGSMHIPRVGQEVIVEFLEGDPDRPIITGRVYNADQTPPYGLPDSKTKSTVKSNSSKGGGGSNELRFEDKKGSEEVYLHGEKDWTIQVKNCENETVGSSISTHAGGSISRNAGANISRTADVNITDKAGKDITTESGKDMSLKAGGSYSLLTNLGIHLKAMNFVAVLIESGAKAAASAIQRGVVSTAATAVATEGAGGDGGGAGVAGLQNTGMQGLAALSPGIEAGAAEITRMSAEEGKNIDAVEASGGKAGTAYANLNNALESGAAPEVVAAAFMAVADSVAETVANAKKVIEGLFPQIPNIELWAMKDINAHALWSMSLSTKVRSISIEAQNKNVDIKGKQSVNIEATKKDLNVKASTKNVVITGKEAVNITAEDKDIVIEAKQKKVFVKSAKQIFLKCGSASISMAESGNIVIKGGKINIDGSEPVTVKGNPIKLN